MDIETCAMLCGRWVDKPAEIAAIKERAMIIDSVQRSNPQYMNIFQNIPPFSTVFESSASPTEGFLVITHCLLPKQHGTRDTCTAEGEEDIEAFITSNDLILIGWIHTHPTQKAFLSSVDLHTHLPFHLMMKESCAIVCALREGSFAYIFFQLFFHFYSIIS